MKFKKLLSVLAGIAPCVFLSAQFSIDFTTAEGYSAGDLVSNSNWNGPFGAFTVDPSASGTVTMDPTALWQATGYLGNGSVLSQNNYTATSAFSLNFTPGESSTITEAFVLGLYEFRNASIFPEYSGFGLRQVEGSGRFNMFVINTLNGSNSTKFSGLIDAADLGLSVVGSGTWLDGTSNELELSYALEYDGTNWNQSLTLTNLTTGSTITTVSLSTIDNDASFRDADQNFRISTDRMNENPVTLTLDSIEVTTTDNPTNDSVFVIIPGPQSNDPLITVEPVEYPGALRNPLKGFRPNLGFQTINHEYGTLARHYIRWNQIENDETDTIDRILDFCNNQWAGVGPQGIKVIPRVYLDWDEKTGNEYWPADMQTGDYTSEQFKQRLVRLISRLGEAWDNDPRVAWVQMGLIGRWGEHHSPSVTAEMQTLMGDAFRDSFKNKKFLVRHADEFTDYEVGYYWDSWAHIYQSDKSAHGAGIDFINTTTDRWKTHPIEGEVAYNWGDYQIQPGGSPDDTLSDPVHKDFLHDLIRKLHCSALGWISEYNPQNPAVSEGAEFIQKAFGYRLVINEFSCSPRVEPGGNLGLSFSVLNTGSAPFLEDWPVELSLLDPQTGEPVWRTFLNEVDIRTWLPGTAWDDTANAYTIPAEEYVVNLSVPLPGSGNLPIGEYIVALAVVDPAGREPAVRFAITNYLQGGRHPFANIGFGVDVQVGHFLDPVAFDDPANEGRLPYKTGQVSPAPYSRLSIEAGEYHLEFGPTSQSNGIILEHSTNLNDWQTKAVKPASGSPVTFVENPSPGGQDFFRLLVF